MFGVLAYTAQMLRNVREGLWIKDELKWVCLTGTVGCFISGVTDVTLSSSPHYDYQVVNQVERTVVMQAIMFFSLDYPVYLSFRDRRTGNLSIAMDHVLHDKGGESVAAAVRPEDLIESGYGKNAGSASEPALVHILHVPEYKDLLASLKQHLVGEFNVECLMFYFAVHGTKESLFCPPFPFAPSEGPLHTRSRARCREKHHNYMHKNCLQ